MSRLMPEFLDSPYVKQSERTGRYTVDESAPEDVRRELKRQIHEWEKEYDYARRQGILL